MKNKVGDFATLLLAAALTVVNGIFLYRGADWFFRGVDRPWDMTAYALIVLPLIGLLAGVAMLVGALRRACFLLVGLAGALVLIVDAVLLILT